MNNNLIVQPAESISGSIAIPSSKSQTLRAILLSSLAHGVSTIENYLPAADTETMIEACSVLGAKITKEPGKLLIEGTSGINFIGRKEIDAGNSGIVLRFFAGIAALSTASITITGDQSIQNQRPIQPLLQALQKLGVHAVSKKGTGFAPVEIQGPVASYATQVHGADSQMVSPLLLAALFLPHPLSIQVIEPGERPWIDMTLSWVKKLGGSYEHNDYAQYTVKGPGSYPGFAYCVPADFSTACFPMAAAIVTDSELHLENLDCSEKQPDSQIIDILKRMGASLEVNPQNRGVRIKKGKGLQGIAIDVNDCIDALPILAVLGCYASGKTHLVNGQIARTKECDRISCMAKELRKMGAQIEECDDGLIITGGPLIGAQMHSHQDHRVAMSLAVAALGAKGNSQIVHSNCIAKTYPDFVSDMRKLGAAMELIP